MNKWETNTIFVFDKTKGNLGKRAPTKHGVSFIEAESIIAIMEEI